MYVVKGLSLCNYLINRGFRVEKVDRDIKNRRYLIFLFKDSDNLRNAISGFSNIK